MIKKSLLLVGLFITPFAASSNWFDDFTTIVGGHIKDVQSRFKDDQLIDGNAIASARFRENDRGQDTLHHGSGSVFIVDAAEGRFVQLAPDFTSTPGPDYHVYVSSDTKVDHEDRFDKANQTELGRLVKGSGASYYRLPENIKFKSVTIWCKAFDEFIMSADFE